MFGSVRPLELLKYLLDKITTKHNVNDDIGASVAASQKLLFPWHFTFL